jgi:hypothetical protein
MEGRKSLQTVQCKQCTAPIKILAFGNCAEQEFTCMACQNKQDREGAVLSADEAVTIGTKMLVDPEEHMGITVKSRGVPSKYIHKTLANFKGSYPDQLPGMIWGKTGVGKTHLAVGYMKRWISERLQPFDGRLEGTANQVNEHFQSVARKALFISSLDIVWNMRSAASTKEAKWQMDQYCGYDLAIVDDFGAERQTDWAIEILNKLIHSRHANGRQTLLTTNVGLKEIAEIFGDRTASRIQEFGERIEVEGKDGRRST